MVTTTLFLEPWSLTRDTKILKALSLDSITPLSVLWDILETRKAGRSRGVASASSAHEGDISGGQRVMLAPSSQSMPMDERLFQPAESGRRKLSKWSLAFAQSQAHQLRSRCRCKLEVSLIPKTLHTLLTQVARNRSHLVHHMPLIWTSSAAALRFTLSANTLWNHPANQSAVWRP